MPRILVITGAGISAESGIPTFRGKDGYWRNRDPMTLATPEAFASDPDLVWEWYRERRNTVRSKVPNAAHQAVVELSTHAKEFLLLTQNVDDLHLRAERDGQQHATEQVVQIHGDLFVTKCSRCSFSRHDEVDEPGVPACPACASPLRPGVVWFGEQLDVANIRRVERFLAGGPCDLVLVVGTTAIFDYIVGWARAAAGPHGEIIEVNPEETRLSRIATRVVREPAAAAVPRIVQEYLG